MTVRVGYRTCAGAVALLMLSGCASLTSWLPSPQAASAPAYAASEPVGSASADNQRAEYLFDVIAPDDLRGLLSTYLDLARFQTAPATEGITNAELARLMQTAPAQARSLLETEGYFNAVIRIERVADKSGKPLLRMEVLAGPRARVSGVDLDATGDIDAAIRAGDSTAKAELDALRRAWPLQPGEPFRQATWDSAKVGTLARLRADGYPAATWAGTNAAVDAAANSVRLQLVAESGPLFRLGEIKVEGVNRYDAESVRRLSTFSLGTPYNEQLLLDYQERIQKAGLFEGVSVELDAAPQSSQAAPVLVRVKELPLQQATFGAGYSANTGPRLSVEYFNRRPFGHPWIARSKLEIGPESKLLQGELTSYPLENLYRNFISGSSERLRSSDELRSSWDARVGRSRDTPQIERSYYAELAHSRVGGSNTTQSADAASGNYHWLLRRVDNVLLPTRGITLAAEAALGVSRGWETENDSGLTVHARGPFARTYGRLTWYRPLGSGWFGTFRGEAGQVFTKSAIAVPDTLLFRAGGDDSVRGYGYRTLGPTVNGDVGSGRNLATASAEVAHVFSQRYPAFLWAVFVDAGDAADRWSELHPAVGYGVGLRWRSPVGPLRVDLAYGERVEQFRVHLSVGVAF